MRFIFINILLALCLAWSHSLKAATFVVTSNADNGAGTLREAISLASINGFATRDFIRFNLPGSTLADRTIHLLTELPSLPSNIEIDGTTQPSAFIGVSGAKVVLTYNYLAGNPNSFAFFFLNEVNDVAIYGMSAKYTGPAVYSAQFLTFGGNTSRITIGAPGRGNVATGCITGIYQQSGNLSYLTMQGNILGLAEDGTIPVNPPLPNACRMQLAYKVSNLFIGGSTDAEGNVMLGAIVFSPSAGQVVFRHNKFNTDYTGTVSDGSGVLWISCLHSDAEVSITDNVFGTAGENNAIYLSMTEKPFTIARNKIGTDVTGANVIGGNREGLLLAYCKNGTVSDNVMAGHQSYGLVVSDCYNVTITKNTMFCNVQGNVSLIWLDGNAGRKEPFVNVTGCTATTISGNATPNATLELFDVHQCVANQVCNGRNYLRSITADANGKWSYNFNGETGLLLTATDTYGATSEYSTAKLDFGGGAVITPTACGKSTGSVKGIKVLRGYDLRWEDLNGNIVSRDTNLLNVPEGWYNLVLYSAGCREPACRLVQGSFHIESYPPAIERTYEMIKPATCGLANGAVTGVIILGLNPRMVWTNALGAEVARGPVLNNVAAGNYFLTVTDTVNGCSANAGPFVVGNQGAPALDESAMQITSASCQQANGGIAGLTASGSGTLTYTWKNAAGITVGTQLALSNVKSGVYILEVRDGGPCSTPITKTFTIPDAGAIVINTAAAVLTPSSCSVPTGAISGITATNAQTFTWTNAAGQVVGNTLDIGNLASGQYQLRAQNASGCEATAGVTVPQVTPAPITVSSRIVRQPGCSENNGSVTDVQFTGVMPAALRWVDESGTVRSNNAELTAVGSGIYRLYARDANQCEQLVQTVEMFPADKPVFVQTDLFITYDQCNAGLGAISGFVVNGTVPFTYAWKRGTEVVATTPDLYRAQAGVYVLEVKDANGCVTTSKQMTIGNNTVPLTAPVYNPVTILKGTDAVLKPYNGPDLGLYTLYAPGSNTALATSDNARFTIPGITATTTFNVVYSRGDCRSAPAPAIVNVVDGISVQAPNAFSPNGDGHNDVFRVKAMGLASVTFFNIHDRWGNLVFTTKDINDGWTGTQNDRKVPAGTYVWSFSGIDLLGKPVKKQGTVVVVY